jgi:hypothetical protein
MPLHTLEWLVACPALILFLSLAGGLDAKTTSTMLYLVVLLTVGGAASALSEGALGGAIFNIASVVYALLMYNFASGLNESARAGKLSLLCSHFPHAAVTPSFPHSPVPAARAGNLLVPVSVAHLIKYQVLISWSIFPIIDMLRRHAMIGFQTAEILNCVNDGIAKVQRSRPACGRPQPPPSQTCCFPLPRLGLA